MPFDYETAYFPPGQTISEEEMWEMDEAAGKIPYEPEPEVSPIVRDAFFDALDPGSSTAIAVKEDGGVTIKANQPPPETKPKEGEGEAETAPVTGTPGAGFDPALAALMGPSGGGISAATLTGLTPEQITGLLGIESQKQRLQQGTIGQLLSLAGRETQVPLDIRTEAMKALIKQRGREPTPPRTLAEAKELKAAPGAPPAYPQGDWWRSPEGDIRFFDKGESVPKDWERVPSREQVPRAETVYEKTIAVKALDTLRSYTHDADTGKPLDVPDTTGISAMNETLRKEGKEAVAIKLPALTRKRAGLDWLKKDLPEQTIYVIVGEGASPTVAEVKDALVSSYGYTPEEADAVIELKRGK